ncbi:MAG: GNAT family N-acetyltransferase [Thermoplasmata archaeon]|nr:MAG: GNAT family N-acetyltransferase [Thermoplasmata archaeon]
MSNRIRMCLALKKQEISETWNARNISKEDIRILGSLMLNAYKGTIDYDGESIEDAISEIKATLNGKYGPFMEKCSFLMEESQKGISAIIVTWFDELKKPLLAFSMTHQEYKNQGFGTYLLKKSINALLDEDYHELYLVVTDGNMPALHLYEKMGFQKT